MAGDANIVTGNYSGRKIIIHLWMKITDSVGSATMLFLYRELLAFIRMTLGFDNFDKYHFFVKCCENTRKGIICSFSIHFTMRNLKRI